MIRCDIDPVGLVKLNIILVVSNVDVHGLNNTVCYERLIKDKVNVVLTIERET